MLTASSQPTSPPTAHGAYLDHVVDAGYHRQLFATHVDLFPAMSALRQVAGGESTDGTGNVKAGDGGVARAKTLAELEAAVGACRNAAGDGRARLDGEVETEQMERLHGQVETVQVGRG